MAVGWKYECYLENGKDHHHTGLLNLLMAIQVLFFGQLTDIAGTAIDLPFVDTLRKLEQMLRVQFPELSSRKYALSVNQKIVTGNVDLADGDTIALLPPFSGG